MGKKRVSKYKKGLVLSNNLVIGLILAIDLLVSSSSTISFEAALLIMFFYLLKPLNKKIQTIYFLLPFQSALVLNENVSLFVFVQIVLLVALMIQTKKINKKSFFLLILFTILQIISTVVYDGSLINLISFVITLSVFILIREVIKQYSNNEYSNIIKSLIYGVLLASSIALYPDLGRIFQGIYIGRFSGLWTNPNLLGMQYSVALALTITLLRKKKITNISGSCLILLILFFSTLTYSRTTIYAILTIFCIDLIHKVLVNDNLNTWSVAFKLFFYTIGFTITVFFMFTIFFEPVIERRGLISNSEDISAGRITLLESNIKWIIQEENSIPLIVGLGVDNNLNYMSTKKFHTQGTHNTYVEMLISSGVLGFIIWIKLLFYVLNIKFKTLFKQQNLFFFVLILYTFTSHLNTSTFFYMVLTLINEKENNMLNRKGNILHWTKNI